MSDSFQRLDRCMFGRTGHMLHIRDVGLFISESELRVTVQVLTVALLLVLILTGAATGYALAR